MSDAGLQARFFNGVNSYNHIGGIVLKQSKGISILSAVLLVLSSVLVLFASGCIDFSPSSKSVDLEEAAPGETLTLHLERHQSGGA